MEATLVIALAAAAWFFYKNRKLRTALASLREEKARLEADLQAAETRRQDQQAQFEKTAEQMSEKFQALAADALQKNNEQFLRLAQERLDRKTQEARHQLDEKTTKFEDLVRPVREIMDKLDKDLKNVEKERKEQFGRIEQQILDVKETGAGLQKATGDLASALQKPGVRGSWGEMQLRRVVELAGMAEHCDFEEQAGSGETDSRQRPDMTVRLPGGRSIVIDAKAVLDAHLDAASATEPDARREALQRHARNFRARVRDLSKKAYWESFRESPEFVVLFVPGEAMLHSAAEADPSLIEDALAERVMIATPTTLVALLKAVAYGWRQEKTAENTRKIAESARELQRRLETWIGHVTETGKKLNETVVAYNKGVGSYERRVLPELRRMESLGGTAEPLPPPSAVDSAANIK